MNDFEAVCVCDEVEVIDCVGDMLPFNDDEGEGDVEDVAACSDNI
jgi:hypothetical protein